MRRVVRHLLTVSTFLAAAAGEGHALSSLLPLSPQASPKPLLSVNLNGNILGTLGGVTNGLTGSLAPPLIDTLNAIGGATNAITNNLTEAVDSVVGDVGGVLGAVGGLLNATAEAVTDILSPNLAHLLTDAPLEVLDGLLTAILHPNPRDPGYLGWQYWGCFYSTTYISTRTPKVTKAADGMSPKQCIALCVADGVDFAIVINYNCYCSNDRPNNTDGSHKCNTVCPLHLGSFCGGIGTVSTAAMSVFRRDITSLPGPLPAIPEPSGWRYSGCYFGDAYMATATFKGYVKYFDTSTPLNASVCISTCTSNGRSYTYSAMYGARCYCSNTAPLFSVQAGVGLCTSRPCQGNTGEACGGESNYAPYLDNPRSLMTTLYVKAPAPPSTTPQKPNTPGPRNWTYWGCYYGALYLLDTILNGLHISALLDANIEMSPDRCISLCLSASVLPNPTLNFAIILGGTCFCNNKPPTEGLLAPNQAMCNEPCPDNSGQRCGGTDPSGSPTFGHQLINILGRVVKVSEFR